MTDSSDRMSIGGFSSLARLSVRMLRHYDEHGVLVPADVDAHTGHRRYASRQLADATVIRQLRDVGFGVSSIAALLAARGTATFAHALSMQRDTLVGDVRAAQHRLATLETLLTDTKERPMSSITVQITTLPAMTVVALRGTIPTYADEGQLWARLMQELKRQGVRPSGPGGAIEHDAAYVETDPDVSVWLPVAPGTTAEAPLAVFDLPEQRTAAATTTGAYAQISEAHARLGRLIGEEGLAEATPDAGGLAGKVVNRYLTDPPRVPEAEQVTEVHRPLA